MSSLAFASPASIAVTARATTVSKCTFVSRPQVVSAARSRAAVMMTERDPRIGLSDYDDGGSTEDSGDGFMGSADIGEMMGVEMPKDLASFELDEINKCETRDELVDRLKIINRRKKDIRDDRRRGMGLDNVGNYLDAL